MRGYPRARSGVIGVVQGRSRRPGYPRARSGAIQVSSHRGRGEGYPRVRGTGPIRAAREMRLFGLSARVERGAAVAGASGGAWGYPRACGAGAAGACASVEVGLSAGARSGALWPSIHSGLSAGARSGAGSAGHAPCRAGVIRACEERGRCCRDAMSLKWGYPPARAEQGCRSARMSHRLRGYPRARSGAAPRVVATIPSGVIRARAEAGQHEVCKAPVSTG